MGGVSKDGGGGCGKRMPKGMVDVLGGVDPNQMSKKRWLRPLQAKKDVTYNRIAGATLLRSEKRGPPRRALKNEQGAQTCGRGKKMRHRDQRMGKKDLDTGKGGITRVADRSTWLGSGQHGGGKGSSLVGQSTCGEKRNQLGEAQTGLKGAR